MREGQDLKEYWKQLKAAAQSLDSRSRNLFLTARAKHSGDDEVEGGPFCHTLGWNYGLTDETAEEILQSDPDVAFTKINALALTHFGKLSRPAVLPSGADNTWYLEVTVEPSEVHESGWQGNMSATLWDESINGPAGSTPVRLFGTAAMWIGKTQKEKFDDITRFFSIMLPHLFSGSYYCLESCSKPNEVFREADFWETVPRRVIMPDSKLGELIMAFLQVASSVKTKSFSRDFAAKRREDPDRQGQTLVACSQCRYIGVEQEEPCIWKKLGRCSGCSVTFYCDQKCQKLHWADGHRDKCKAKQKRRSASRVDRLQMTAGQSARKT